MGKRSFAASFERFLRAPAARQTSAAAALLREEPDWEAWRERFNLVHERAPELEVRAARVLRAACRRSGARAWAARFRLLEARALHRVGSPREAAKAFEDAARELDATGEPQRAAQARVVRVDALAVAGRVEEALRSAKRTERSLRGSWAVVWRQALRVNVANALRLRGDLERSVELYDAAARALVRLGQGHTASIARMNAGVALLDAGLAREARDRFEEAARGFEAVGQSDFALEARYNAACALVRDARLGEGVRALEALRREHGARGLLRREALCRVDLADALFRAGDRLSAAREAEQAAAGFARTDAGAERADALLLAAAAAPSPVEATRALRAARHAALRGGRPGVALRCDLRSVDVALRAGRSVRPSRVEALARQASTLGQDEVAADAQLLLGELALGSGRTAEARRRFDTAARAGSGRPWIRAAAEAGRASCLAREGRRTQALRDLRRVAEFFDAVRGDLPGPWLRTTFVSRALDPALARIDLLLDHGRAEDRREAEALLDALATRRFLERPRPRAVRGTLDRLRRRLEAIYDRLGRGAGPLRGMPAAELAQLEAQARELERAVAEAWRVEERGSRRRPGHAMARPRVARLARPEGALHAWTHRDRVRLLLRRGEVVVGSVLVGSVSALQEEVERLRFLADRARLFGGAPGPSLLHEALAALADRLLGTFGPGLRGLESLRLVLDPEVPDLPWELLPLEGRPLSAALSLLRVPALAVRRPVTNDVGPTTVVALGDADLPGVAAEVGSLGGGARLLAGSDASRAALQQILAQPGIVHLAGHGFTAPDAPPLGGVRVSDGWFAATDLPDHVVASVVVLAACRTGIERGAAAAWGALPIALLRAGARRVLWTSDDVDDAVAARVSAAFHASVRTLGAERSFGELVQTLWADAQALGGMIPFRLSGVLP